jgi:Na+/H+ antiporter NhaC
MLAGVMGGLYVTGMDRVELENPGLKDIVGAADSVKALMWGSLLGAMTAGTLSMVQRILTLEQVVNAWYQGMRAMIYAMIILVLAWALGNITQELKTAEYLVSVLGDALPIQLLPACVFVIAAATAFATGSSWGAMAILVPLVIPLAWAVMQLGGHTGAADMHLFYSSVASVLAGCVWGDHCSPISDTTILSSMASGCDHVEHVRTQMPYALLVGGVGLLGCSLPVAFGLPWWLALGASAALLYLLLRLLGRAAVPASP